MPLTGGSQFPSSQLMDEAINDGHGIHHARSHFHATPRTDMAQGLPILVHGFMSEAGTGPPRGK